MRKAVIDLDSFILNDLDLFTDKWKGVALDIQI